LDQCLEDMVGKNIVSRDVARQKASNPDNF
jgi:hypothetical protein